jgi:hypothetical protein
MAKKKKERPDNSDNESIIGAFELQPERRKSFTRISQTFFKIFRRISVWIAIISMLQYRYWTGIIFKFYIRENSMASDL